jgi:hypothetical protein
MQRLHRIATGTRKGTMTAKDRKGWEAQPVADRPYERVWRTRASGKRYSSSSKLMQDTGRLRQGLINMRTSVHVEGSRAWAEFRPGVNVKYADRQNALRPLWVWNPPVDAPVIGQFVADGLTEYLAAAMRSTK